MIVLGAWPIGLHSLEAAGFNTPTTLENSDWNDVAKALYDCHFEMGPVLKGEGALYKEFQPTGPFDYKYYATDGGNGFSVRVHRSTSKLYDEKESLDLVELDPGVTDIAAENTVKRLIPDRNGRTKLSTSEL